MVLELSLLKNKDLFFAAQARMYFHSAVARLQAHLNQLAKMRCNPESSQGHGCKRSMMRQATN
jgi:hypothetical protein